MEETTHEEKAGSGGPHEWRRDWHHWHRGRFFVLRWILGLIILAIVFCVGMKVGEFKGAFGGDGFHGRGMRGYRAYPPMMRQGPPKAYPLQNQTPPQTQSQSIPAPTQ